MKRLFQFFQPAPDAAVASAAVAPQPVTVAAPAAAPDPVPAAPETAAPEAAAPEAAAPDATAPEAAVADPAVDALPDTAVDAPPADATGERCVQTRIGDKHYQITSDDNYLNSIEGEFEPDIVRLFDALVGPDDTVLDIGANIGCTSILFGERARQVYSFEPSPTTFAFLQKNVQAAGGANVTLVNRGLGKTAGSFELTFSTNNRSGGFVSDKTSASEGHQVEAIHILNGDDYVREQAIGPVHFIKIDVEGFEQNVIEGLAATIARDRPVVALELNHWCLSVFQRGSVPDFFDFLRSVFPYLYAVEKDDVRDLHDNDSAYHVMYHHIVCGFQYPNLVGAFAPQQLEKLAAGFTMPVPKKAA